MKNNRILKALNYVEEFFLCINLTIMAVICFIQVITRYLFHFSLPWSEELLRGLFVWSSCLGISVGFKTRSHLGVDALVNVFPKKIGTIVKFLTYLVSIAFFVVLIYYSAQICMQQYSTMQKTIAMRLPIVYISCALPICFIVTIFRVLQVMKEDFTKKPENEEVHISEGLL